MENLTKKQNDLLETLRENNGANTHRLAAELGHRQAYETSLRDRLFRLAARGLVRFEERRVAGRVVARRWFVA